MLRKCALLVLIFSLLVSGLDLDQDGFDSDPSEGEFQDCCDTVDDGCYDPYMVNPGAWEIPDNGQADRCIEGIDQLAASLPCDRIIETLTTGVQPGDRGIYQQFIGALVTPLDTEPGIFAMDICEFKDDDDDPSWGFARQENLIFALSDETRNGFDFEIVGPNINQASVLSSWGRIQPYNGRYFLAISSGLAYSFLDNADVNNGITYGPFTTDSTVVQAIPEWSNAPRTGTDYQFFVEGDCGPDNGEPAFDSILARFSMQQPTNMGAFSIKVAMVDSKRNGGMFRANGSADCGNVLTFAIVTKNDTGIPLNGNIAYDKSGWLFSSYNPNTNFFEICNEYGALTNPGAPNTCPKTNYLLEFTNFYESEYATDWIPIGTSATPGEPFQLKFTTWDRSNGVTDTTLLLDDYIPIAEPRTFTPSPYGYQYTSDIELSYLRPTLNGIYPSTTQQITLSFSVKNNGPEIAGDIAINFTPPKGTRFASTSWGGPSLLVPGLGDFVDNGFYKYLISAPLAVGESRSGSVTFDVLTGHPNDIQFKLSVTCSSIETVFGNNFQVQQVYIDAPIF